MRERGSERPNLCGFIKRRLKQVDAFKQNVNLIWYRRNKESGKMEYVDEQGSWFGGINTFIYLLSMVALLSFKHIVVFKGEDDKYISYELQNDFDNPKSSIIDFA